MPFSLQILQTIEYPMGDRQTSQATWALLCLPIMLGVSRISTKSSRGQLLHLKRLEFQEIAGASASEQSDLECHEIGARRLHPQAPGLGFYSRISITIDTFPTIWVTCAWAKSGIF